jgi:1-deoxy-D-xylulose-5-phosphate reductoisomerase
MKRVVILGSTGSIGRMALDVIARSRDRFTVSGLVAGRNIDLLETQVKTFRPEVVAVAGEADARELRKRLGRGPEVLAGAEGINTVASHGRADFVLSAMVGFSGLMPTLHAVRAGKVIGLANKETLVIAGSLIMEEARQRGVVILPVDSEHSAIFQCIQGHDMKYLRRVILTASGGPFMGKTARELRHVTLEDALKHPKWNMGKKVTIDSATLMNKGLEVIEASHLFGLDAGRIDVLVHPQSIVHSMVEFTDGGLLAQISMPDMRGPIAYALSYPQRLENMVPPLELDAISNLTFCRPDSESFPCLGFAYAALREGGTMPAVLNAANEVLVNAFLKGKIPFTRIPVIIEKTMQFHETQKAAELDAVIAADRWAREKTEEFIRKT